MTKKKPRENLSGTNPRKASEDKDEQDIINLVKVEKSLTKAEKTWLEEGQTGEGLDTFKKTTEFQCRELQKQTELLKAKGRFEEARLVREFMLLWGSRVETHEYAFVRMCAEIIPMDQKSLVAETKKAGEGWSAQFRHASYFGSLRKNRLKAIHGPVPDYVRNTRTDRKECD